MINKVEICGINTSKLPVLSRDEKNSLFIKIKQGDMEAITPPIKEPINNRYHVALFGFVNI